ncbi:MAG: ion channel protein [Mycobacteriaceae bacterium]|nr:ion channel protein [Mycobacteriaceae bacterium]
MEDAARRAGDSAPNPTVRGLVALAIPALFAGVASALILIALSVLANKLQRLLWVTLPDRFGIGSFAGWWVFGVLSVAGLVVGLLVWLLPGHAGPDPATTGLLSRPLAVSVVPGLAVVVVIGLAGGVSLGPENPIVAINVALMVGLAARFWAKLPGEQVTLLTAAATIGALFGTPVGAALVFTEMMPRRAGVALWSQIFAPLLAAAAGAMTMVAFGRPVLSVRVPDYRDARLVDVLTGSGIAVVAALLCVLAVYLFPVVHRLFHSVHPTLALSAGGMVLGVLAVVGGELTMFKGLDEMKTLTATAGDRSVAGLALITVVKLGALLIAASCGFRGGRIFPAVFVGVGVGLTACAAFHTVPTAVGVASGVLGALMVVARDGWLALFMAATTVGDIDILPVLCIVSLPVWLFVMNAREMLIAPEPATTPASGPP